jgi:ABC-2 type transport system permease protein
MRYGFLGHSDVPVGIALGVCAAFALAFAAWTSWLFRTGHRLKP